LGGGVLIYLLYPLLKTLMPATFIRPSQAVVNSHLAHNFVLKRSVQFLARFIKTMLRYFTLEPPQTILIK